MRTTEQPETHSCPHFRLHAFCAGSLPEPACDRLLAQRQDTLAGQLCSRPKVAQPDMHCGVVVFRLCEIEAVRRVPASGPRRARGIGVGGGKVDGGVGSECPPGRWRRRVDVRRCEQGVGKDGSVRCGQVRAGDGGGWRGVFFLFFMQERPGLATFPGGRWVRRRVGRAVVCALRVRASLGPPEQCAGHSAFGPPLGVSWPHKKWRCRTEEMYGNLALQSSVWATSRKGYHQSINSPSSLYPYPKCHRPHLAAQGPLPLSVPPSSPYSVQNTSIRDRETATTPKIKSP